MFNIKRLMSLGLMLLMLSTMLVFNVGAASAHTNSPARAAAYCSNTGCDGKSPLSGCDVDAVTEFSATSSDLGGGVKATVSLRFSRACQAAWAQVVMNKSMPNNHAAYGLIVRSDGKQYTCGSANGNGIISVNETSCYSAMLGDSAPYYAHANAYYAGSDDNFHRVAMTANY